MGLDGIKTLFGNAAELLRGDSTTSALPDASKKDEKATGNSSNDDYAVQAVTKRFVESQNAHRLIAANPSESPFVQTDFNQTFSPKAVILPLKAGVKNASYEELSRRTVQTTLEQNGIHPSNIEMEEIMALPQNQRIDLNESFGKNWKVIHVPGLMPSPAKVKDINGQEVFGYKMTLSPQWQAGIMSDYKQVCGELSKSENINRKAVVDMNMTERLNEMVKIAWEKGCISDEVKKQLGSLTPEELAGAFAAGGVVGIVGTTEAGGAVLGPAGLVITGAYTAKQMMTFSSIADDCAKATNRQQLSEPAKEFGAFLGNLSKDGVLALVGMAGGMTAPRVIPQVEEALTNKVGNVKQILKDSLPKLDEPRLATANGAPIETTNIKPTSKTALENNEPLKITTIDENGKPSGTRFRDDYESHVKQREFTKASQKTGVSGAHDINEFEKYGVKLGVVQTKESINIISKTPHPTVKGIYKIEYQMPKLDAKGQPTGLWRNKVFPKTVYDPAVISDKQMAEWGRQAFADAVQKNAVELNGKWHGQSPNGLEFEGYVDQSTKAVRTFYPLF